MFRLYIKLLQQNVKEIKTEEKTKTKTKPNQKN